MNITQRNGRSAFTLIELMAVVTIIIILAGLVVGGLGFVTERQAREKAKVQIALLSKAIEEYKLDMGVYPGTDNTPSPFDVSAQLYDALFYDGYQYTSSATPPANWTKATKIYLPELDPRTSKQGWVTLTSKPTDPPPAGLKIVDPWNKGYLYRKGTTAMNPDFDLWSMGKDGLTNGGTTASAVKDTKNVDDIRNF
jgi:general secretion pathway protein G